MSNQELLKEIAWHMREYFWNSNERRNACLLLVGVILTTTALVGLTTLFAWWTAGFWAAIESKNAVLFFQSMMTFSAIAGGYVSFTALKNYFIDRLSINWRCWLTERLVSHYLEGDKNYLHLARNSSQLNHPAQRIQQGVRLFVDTTLLLFSKMLKSVLSFITFAAALWVVGGSLSFVVGGVSIIIPGYLVWIGLGFAAAGSILTKKIGAPLERLNDKEANLEADLRATLEQVEQGAENVAQERGESYYQESLKGKLSAIASNAYQKLRVGTRLVAFQSFYRQITYVMPYLIAIPLYFAGQIELGQFMQVGVLFREMNKSLSWFIRSYGILAPYKANVERIHELECALKASESSEMSHDIKLEEKETNENETSKIEIRTLSLQSSTGLMISKLNLTLKAGENTLIQGKSGLGKSTLFKAIAGTWRQGEGEIVLPQGQSMCFLPQSPSLPWGTLKSVLAYPEPANTYQHEQYVEVWNAVSDRQMAAFAEQLDEAKNWTKQFSLGQQQRIAVARALLREPDWLFLDEVTASLDTEGEAYLYNLIRTRLQNKTTFVSIAHRPTVGLFHERTLMICKDEEDGRARCIEGNPRRGEAAANDAGAPWQEEGLPRDRMGM